VSGERLSVRLVNEMAEITRMAGIVEDFCARHDIPSGSALQVTLAVEEALTNTISYGFADAGRHEIALEMAWENDELTIEIADGGKAFDPLQAPAPDRTSPLGERPIGGLGIFLARTMMDAVEYRREGGRNHLRLRKRIAAEPG